MWDVANPFDGAEDVSLNQAEYRLQVAVVKHLASAFPSLLYTHVPNRSKTAQEGFFRKAMGVRPGVADLIFWWASGHYGTVCSAAIELKASKGRESSQQNKFASIFTHLGGKYAVCKSVREVHEALKSWGLKPRHEGCIEPDTRSKNQKFLDAYEAFKP